MLDISHLGDRIRAARKKKVMTIKTLSQYTGLSVGYLSTLEQNKTTPTIDNLAKICEILEISITDILQLNEPGSIIIRKHQIREEQHAEENMTVGIIDFKQNNLILEYITIQSGETAKKQEYRHVCDEMCTVLTGVLSIDIEGKSYELNPGDSVFIKRGERHRIYNQTEKDTLSLWIYQKSTENLI